MNTQTEVQQKLLPVKAKINKYLHISFFFFFPLNHSLF